MLAQYYSILTLEDERKMGAVRAEIIVKNNDDLVRAKHGHVKKQAVRSIAVKALVDTGAGTLVINDEQFRQLGLGVREEKEVTLANNAKEKIKIADPVEIHWKNRTTVCLPWVVSDTPSVLLGAIPLEDMDLIVDPKNQELVGRHGDKMEGYL